MATTTTRGPQPGPLSPTERTVTQALAAVSSRLRRLRWVRHAARGALVSLGLALVTVALAHFNLLPEALPLEILLPALLVLGVGAGTVTALLRPIPLMEAARLAESRLGLKERLSSALEFERSPRAAGDPEAALLLRLQAADAAAHARSLNAAEAVPWRWPWEAKAAAGGLLLLGLALWLPNLPALVPPQLRIERQIVRKTGDNLEKKAAVIQKLAETKHLEGTRKAAADMKRLGHKLATGKLDKKQAMVQMSKLTQQMRQAQQKAAQGTPGAGEKSLAQAGQQLSQSLAAGAKSAGGHGAPKPGDPKQGFNVPTNGSKSGASPSNHPSPTTPEMQKAAQAMRQNDTKALSEQLRQLADKAASGKLSPSEQQQAAADLQKLSNALKDTPMPETQKHTQAAAEAMKRGDKQAAASEMRKAADAAEREARAQADQQAMQNAQNAAEDAQSQMAGASSAGDIKDDSGPPGDGSGKNPGKGQGNGQGQAPGEGFGDGIGKGQQSGGKMGSGKGNGGSGGGGKAVGKPSDTGQGSSPIKHLGHTNGDKGTAKVYFGKALNAGPSKTGPTRKVGGGKDGGGAAPSSVPYYDYVAPAKKSAETTMDKEDIPPAYRRDVRRYFQSLDPPAPPPSGGSPSPQ